MFRVKAFKADTAAALRDCRENIRRLALARDEAIREASANFSPATDAEIARVRASFTEMVKPWRDTIAWIERDPRAH